MSEQLGPLTDIHPALPADWASVTPRQKNVIKAGLHEILDGLGCKCNGTKVAIDSVAATVNERIRALAITRRVDTGLRELATAAGVDVEKASPGVIIAASTPEQVQSLIQYEALITQGGIEDVVTNAEMGTIQKEEIARNPQVADPDWEKDLTQFVNRASPHDIAYWQPVLSQVDEQYPGLYIVESQTLKLDTIRPTVDRNGEIMSWRYEESVR